MMKTKQSIYERFSSKYKETESGCYEWVSTLSKHGYGKFWFRSQQFRAHRASYILHVGEIPDGLWVLHKCDNSKCVNPAHLYLGTAKQNAKDMSERSDWWGARRIPFETVEEIRRLYRTGISQQVIADTYGINQTQVSRYIRKKQRAFK